MAHLERMTPTENSGLTVIKLGGSLVEAPELRRWLARIVEEPGPQVVVPGGGRFADAVRDAQAPLGLGEAACHRMALLAMAQLGCALVGMEPRLVAAPSVAEVQAALGQGRRPVWLPLDLLAGHAEIEENWRVTSDSLALWLARALGADLLLLVKSAGMPEGEATAEALARTGLVDAAFPAWRAGFEGEVRLVHRSALDLAGGCRCG
jgi:aspartokinase-like uncharacterized kinase